MVCVVEGLCQSKMSKWNFANQYNPDFEYRYAYALWEENDSLSIVLKIMLRSGTTKRGKGSFSKEKVRFIMWLTNSYESKSTLNRWEFESKKKEVEPNSFSFNLKIKKPIESSSYLFVMPADKEDVSDINVLDIPISKFNKPQYSKVKISLNTTYESLVNNFISDQDTLILETDSDSTYIRCEYYRYLFQPALPPMSMRDNSESEIRIFPDTTIYFKSPSKFITSKRGAYVFTNKEGGPGKRILFNTSKTYPALRKVKDLVDPILYIASDEERRQIKSSTKPKIKLDEFWLDLTKDKQKSKLLLKAYYQRVLQANSLFADYKDGWKTDRGMIYIIFGPPTEVYKSDYRQLWKYKKTNKSAAVTFIFEEKLGPFGTIYYDLVNSEEYTNVWFNKVDSWRKGIIE